MLYALIAKTAKELILMKRTKRIPRTNALEIWLSFVFLATRPKTFYSTETITRKINQTQGLNDILL